MSDNIKETSGKQPEDFSEIDVHYESFSDRIREIRKESGMTQEEFAKHIGTSKQILSLYELGQRSPKIEQAKMFAEKLKVSVDYLLGDKSTEVKWKTNDKQNKPFYKIFIDVTAEMGLDIPGIIRVTGMTDNQVRMIIFKRMKDAPLPLALQLSDTLGVPLRVWTGEKDYIMRDISAEAYEVAHAYDKASYKERNIARLALDLELITSD